MEPQLVLFRRQYLQLFEPDFLSWPPLQLLRNADAQSWLYKNLFDSSRNSHLPPPPYQVLVLKPMIAKIEKAIGNPKNDGISDDLRSHLSALTGRAPRSDLAAAQQTAYVTFTCLAGGTNQEDGLVDEPTVTVLERRHLVSGSRITGFMTWEASLHLGAYLLSQPGGRSIVHNKSVLELGAGTGFLSALCAKHLNSSHVTTTDGDDVVVEYLKESLILNGVYEGRRVKAKPLWWGEQLKETWLEDDMKAQPYDVVIGADITYHKDAIIALVDTLRQLFELRPTLQVIIAATIRIAVTFDFFREACSREGFHVEDIAFEAKPVRQQKALFYAAAVPFRIVSITAPSRQ